MSVSLPKSVIEKIDKVVESKGLGYKSRPEFIKDAVRRLFEHYNIPFEVDRNIQSDETYTK